MREEIDQNKTKRELRVRNTGKLKRKGIPCGTTLIICKDDLIKLLNQKIKGKIDLQISTQETLVRCLHM
jgi:hypothetical protein